MASSSKGKKKPELGERLLTIRRRLHDALRLGIRSHDNNGRKWQCSDVEIQYHVLRAMTAFIDCVSSSVVRHPLIKDSISDMLMALEAILQSDNERILNEAGVVTLKIVKGIENTLSQYHILEAFNSLLRLLSLYKLPVAISCAIAVNCILKKLGSLRNKDCKEVWKAVEKANTVAIIVCALQDYVEGVQPLEFFLEMASVLTTILWRWPPSRYHVWSNKELMAKLGDHCACSDSSVVVSVLKLYSAIALCGDGALKLLENEVSVSNMIQGMETSKSVDVRIEALVLCQHLMRSSKGPMLTSAYCESIVQGIINAMGGWRSSGTKKVSTDQMPLVMEACRAALITRWAGDHHSCFWNLGIEKVLVDILIGDCVVVDRGQVLVSFEELLTALYDNVRDTRPYVWDILGWLATYCKENFLPKTKEKQFYLDGLIYCACSMAKDLMHKGWCYKPELEPVNRAVLQMLFSHCKYISSQARYFLTEKVRPLGDSYLEYLLVSLKLVSTGDLSLLSNSFQTIVNVIALTCYSALPHYQKPIAEKKGVQILCAIIKRCLDNDIHVGRSNITSHLHSSFDGRTCCWTHVVEWEGGDIILFQSLQALSQLIWFSDFVCYDEKITSGEITTCVIQKNSEAQVLVESLLYILSNAFSPGVRWYAGYILSFFGFYGFPSKFGKRMENALSENELADIQLTLSDGQSLGVHGVVLLARCPSLLPPEEFHGQERACGDESTLKKKIERYDKSFRRVVRISDRVDSRALIKILEFVYTGFFQVNDDLVKHLKVLSKYCNLKYLSCMLHHELPRWGIANPSCDFNRLLEATKNLFSDVILEAELTAGAAWSCASCQSSIPHLHAHRIVLWSSCDYFKGLYQSGMHDSHAPVIKVPVGWIALTKLFHWVYTGKLPRINRNCVWNNMDPEKQFHELQAYVELSSLAEFWLLEEVREESFNVIVSCLGTDQKISLKIIQIAIELDQWNIVEAVVKSIASLYPKIRATGDLEDLDEQVVEMLRVEYVHYSQGCHD